MLHLFICVCYRVSFFYFIFYRLRCFDSATLSSLRPLRRLVLAKRPPYVGLLLCTITDTFAVISSLPYCFTRRDPPYFTLIRRLRLRWTRLRLPGAKTSPPVRHDCTSALPWLCILAKSRTLYCKRISNIYLVIYSWAITDHPWCSRFCQGVLSARAPPRPVVLERRGWQSRVNDRVFSVPDAPTRRWSTTH